MKKILLAVLFLSFSSVVANASTGEDKICSGFAKWMEDGTFKQIRESKCMTEAEYKIDNLKEPLKNPCYIPSYTFFLDYQGDVLICPHDWGKKIILGNFNLQSLKEIWFSKKAIKIRSLLNQSNRNFSPCNVCDVDGTLLGENISRFFS